MSLIQISVSSQEDELSVRITIRGAPLVLQIGHPLLAFVAALSSNDYAKALQCIDPLKIVDEKRVPSLDNTTPEPVVKSSSEPSEKSTATEENYREELTTFAKAVKEGLNYYEPDVCDEGVNGTYFLKDKEGEYLAVFKPVDEEGRGSPKKSNDDPIDFGGLRDGEGAIREVAAFMLDKEHFSGVPATEMIHFEEFRGEKDKVGSIQQFVEHEGSAEDIGPNVFPVHEVHKIGVLDVRILNNDRHCGNILYKRNENGEYELTPIDHGLSLPATIEHVWFDWMTWPQAKQPFDEETKKYIDQIDVEQDAKVLRQLGIREECIANMKIATAILKKGCATGKTLYDIGNVVSRTELDKPSKLEQILERNGGILTPEDEDEIFV